MVAEGWRTGPAATLLVFGNRVRERSLPWRWWREGTHVAARVAVISGAISGCMAAAAARAGRMGNHCYLWVKKSATGMSPR